MTQRDWQYELRRESDGLRIDRAMEYHVLERAAIQQIKTAGLRTGRNYLIVHLPTGQVVSRWTRHRIEGEQTWGWYANHELIHELETRPAVC